MRKSPERKRAREDHFKKKLAVNIYRLMELLKAIKTDGSTERRGLQPNNQDLPVT